MVKRPTPQSRIERQRVRDYEARQALHARRRRRRIRDNWVAGLGAVVVCGLAIGAQIIYFEAGPGKPAPQPTETPGAVETAPPVDTPTPAPGPDAPDGANTGPVPDPSLAEDRTWPGSMTINGIELGFELDGVLAPQATAVLIDAARTGWYEGKHCPRIAVYDTMQVLQCGTESPDSTASEPGFGFGPIENAPEDDVYPAGTIAMARVGEDGWSMGHQFFIVTSESTIPRDSAGGYTVVGRVTTGLGELIGGVMFEGTTTGGVDGPPSTPVVIESFTIG